MLYLSFSQLAYCIIFYPEEYQILRSYYNQSRSMPMEFEDAWNILLKICPECYQDILDTMKPKILMALYTAVSYELQKVESKSCVMNAYLDFATSNEEKINDDSVRKALFRSTNDLQQSNRVFSSIPYNCINLQYLAPYWNSDQDFKCLNPLDFYFYLKNYKHWALYPDHSNGITFYEWLKGIDSIVYHDKSDTTSPLPEKVSLDDELSAYITEQLFHPIAFCKNVLDFFKYFDEDFSNSHFSRELAMRLFIPLSYLPISWQDSVMKTYSNALRDYIKGTGNLLEKLHFGSYLKQIYFYAGCLQSFAESFLASCLLPCDFQSIEDILPSIKEVISKSITDALAKNPNSSYYAHMNSYLNKFYQAVYPKTAENKEILFSDNNSRKRNNHLIETFEINYTFFFFQAVPLYTLAQYHITTGSFMPIDQYISQRCFWFYNSPEPPNYDTSNYLKYKNQNAIILGSSKKTEPKKMAKRGKKR